MRCAHDLKIQPRKYEPKSGNEGTHHYTSDEDLYVALGTSIDWSDNDDTILKLIMKVQQLDDNYITNIFGERRNGIRTRALIACKSGNIDPSTLKVAEAKSKVDNEDVYLFRVFISPSLKSKPYWTTLVFKKETGEYVPSPTSRCDCPAGALFCSHMLAFLLMLMVVQNDGRRKIKSVSNLVDYMPEHMNKFKSMLFPVDFVYTGIKPTKGKPKKKRRVTQQDAATLNPGAPTSARTRTRYNINNNNTKRPWKP